MTKVVLIVVKTNFMDSFLHIFYKGMFQNKNVQNTQFVFTKTKKKVVS